MGVVKYWDISNLLSFLEKFGIGNPNVDDSGEDKDIGFYMTSVKFADQETSI